MSFVAFGSNCPSFSSLVKWHVSPLEPHSHTGFSRWHVPWPMKKNLRTLSIPEETVYAAAMETCAPQSSLLARGANFMPIYHREWELVL